MIHPDSKLGRMQATLEAARTAYQAALDRFTPIQEEARSLDGWIESVDLDTPPLEFAKKHARRVILATVMTRMRAEQAEQRHALAELEKQYRPTAEAYDRITGQLSAMDDPTSDMARLTPPYQLERTRRDFVAWMREWTEPAAPSVGALTLQEV